MPKAAIMSEWRGVAMLCPSNPHGQRTGMKIHAYCLAASNGKQNCYILYCGDFGEAHGHPTYWIVWNPQWSFCIPYLRGKVYARYKKSICYVFFRQVTTLWLGDFLLFSLYYETDNGTHAYTTSTWEWVSKHKPFRIQDHFPSYCNYRV